jgi:transcription elongation GreA/GreB family factor
MSVTEAIETLPEIRVSNAEGARLSAIAAAAAERVPEVAAVLLRELERAEVVPDDLMPADVIRIGSTAEVEIDDGRRLTVKLPSRRSGHKRRTNLRSYASGCSPSGTFAWAKHEVDG